MFEARDIRERRGHNVVDSGGYKIWTLESVYVDTGTDQPTFATSHSRPADTAPACVPPPGGSECVPNVKITYHKRLVKMLRRSALTGSCQPVTKRRFSNTTTSVTSLAAASGISRTADCLEDRRA
jgi:hypothetical protein